MTVGQIYIWKHNHTIETERKVKSYIWTWKLIYYKGVLKNPKLNSLPKISILKFFFQQPSQSFQIHKLHQRKNILTTSIHILSMLYQKVSSNLPLLLWVLPWGSCLEETAVCCLDLLSVEKKKTKKKHKF